MDLADEPARRRYVDLRPLRNGAYADRRGTTFAEADGISYLRPEIVMWMKAHRDRSKDDARPGRDPAPPRSADRRPGCARRVRANSIPTTAGSNSWPNDGRRIPAPELLPAPSHINPVLFIGIGAARARAARRRLGVRAGHGTVRARPDQQSLPGLRASPRLPQATATGHQRTNGQPTDQPTDGVAPTPTLNLTPRPPNDDTELLLTHVPEAFATRARRARSSSPCSPWSTARQATRSPSTTRCTRTRSTSTRSTTAAFVARRSSATAAAATTRTRTERSPPRATAGRQSTSTRSAASRSAVTCATSDGPPSITWTDDRLLHTRGGDRLRPETRTGSCRSGRAEAGPIP